MDCADTLLQNRHMRHGPHNAKKGPRYRLELSKLTDRRNKKLSGTRSCTKDQGSTTRFNAQAHFPRTHDVAKGKNLGTMQAIEDITDIGRAPEFYNQDERLSSSTSVSICV